MTRKDYKIIAEVFNDFRLTANSREKLTLRKVINAFMKRAKLSNPRFSDSKFLTACGIK